METGHLFFKYPVVSVLNKRDLKPSSVKAVRRVFSHLLLSESEEETILEDPSVFRLFLHRFAHSYYHLSEEARLMLRMYAIDQKTQGAAFAKEPKIREKTVLYLLTRGGYHIMVGSMGYHSTQALIYKKVKVAKQFDMLV